MGRKTGLSKPKTDQVTTENLFSLFFPGLCQKSIITYQEEGQRAV